MNKYTRWLSKELEDKDLMDELVSVEGNDEEINDRFYRDLDFGTGGIRGVIGAGTNRINIYTIGKATQGLANYLNSTKKDGQTPSVSIAYDSRNKGEMFSKEAARVLVANNIKVYLYKELMPTPALSFAVRYLKTDAGICVTASHNPAKYSGYKVYGSDGCQATEEMADAVMSEISNTDIFDDVKRVSFEKALSDKMVEYIDEDTIAAFLNAVCGERVLSESCDNLSVVFTPLNGSGRRCVLEILDKIGVKDISIVKEQEMPDGNFPTCPYPNPEFKEALQKGLDLCEKVKPDLLLATDPDCDRVGIAVKQGDEFKLMSGNEVGILLLDFIAKNKKVGQRRVAVTTVVSTDMVDCIAKDYDIEFRRVLTGFKYIGDVIAELENVGEESAYVLGFEESYGYLSGTYVRDKDAVNGSMLICEMASHYKTQGKTLIDVMTELYEKYGYYKNDLLNFTFEGEDGMNKMAGIMSDLRNNTPKEVAGYKVVGNSDYLLSVKTEGDVKEEIKLPKSNVMELRLENGAKYIVRPSGTEPKIKVYLSVKGKTSDESDEIIEKLKEAKVF